MTIQSFIKTQYTSSNQFYFQQGHSKEHAVMELVDQINDNFGNNCFTLDVFIDLSKALISKLENHGVKENNLKLRFKIFQNLRIVFYFQHQFNWSSTN